MKCEKCNVELVEDYITDHDCSNGICKMVKVKVLKCPECGEIYRRQK